MKSHYDTLGVTRTATKAEIKAAFRKLCMETHPDVAKDKVNAERFKQVVEAHSVLSDDKARRRYDYEVEEALRFGIRRTPSGGFNNHAGFGGGYGGHYSGAGPVGRTARPGTSSFAMAVLDGIYRPRNLILGITLGFATLAYVKSFFADDDQRKRTGMKNLVEAWKNPRTGQWEQPAPWDENYRRLRPTLHFVPREEVRQRRR